MNLSEIRELAESIDKPTWMRVVVDCHPTDDALVVRTKVLLGSVCFIYDDHSEENVTRVLQECIAAMREYVRNLPGER